MSFTINGYLALDRLLEYTNTKAAVIQAKLAESPELTEQVYAQATEAAEKVASGDLYWGLGSAALAGWMGGLAIYHACRKE